MSSGFGDLFGWSNGELISIARWYLMRGYGLAGGDDGWQMEYSREGLTCGDRRPAAGAANAVDEDDPRVVLDGNNA